MAGSCCPALAPEEEELTAARSRERKGAPELICTGYGHSPGTEPSAALQQGRSGADFTRTRVPESFPHIFPPVSGEEEGSWEDQPRAEAAEGIWAASPINPLLLLPGVWEAVQGTGVGSCSLCPAPGARLSPPCSSARGCPAMPPVRSHPGCPCTLHQHGCAQLGHCRQHELVRRHQKVPVSHCGVENTRI